VAGFTESLRTELLHEGSEIRVSEVRLPALNTPQFEWVLSRLPNRPQPVPPIYQPEVAARAVVWASDHPRREVWVGASTSLTIRADKLAPGLLDRYLGRTGVDSQQTDEPADPDRPANLWEPVPGDHGARGRFDDQARRRSLQLWAATHRGLVGAGAAALGALVVATSRARRR
jgi:hypothetical protein